eukprot:388128_1
MELKPGQKYKVVIVGAGIVGTSIATQFCQSEHLNCKFEIVLIDKYDPRNIQYKYKYLPQDIPATWFSPGWINASWKTPYYYNTLNRLSLEMWPNFLKRLNIKPADVEYKRKGTLIFSDSSKATKLLQHNINTSKRFGCDYYQITKNELKSLIPTFDMRTIDENSVYYYNNNEAIVNPLKVSQKCLNYVLNCKNTQFIRGEVIGFSTSSINNVNIVLLANGNMIRCDYVILASGTSVPNMISLINQNIKLPIANSKGLLVECKMKHNIKANVSMIKKFSGLYNYSFMVKNCNYILMSGGGSYPQPLMNKHEKFKKEICLKWFMHFKDITMNDCKVIGPFYRPMPQDRKPVIGFIDCNSNVYVSMMHSGVTLAPAISKLIFNEFVMKVNGDNNGLERLKDFRLQRFKTINSRM